MAKVFTVLFVEDDSLVRESVAFLLSQKGFHVLAASNGYDALEILAQQHVDVLFTDIVMPGLNGVDLARQAKFLRPNLKIMFATGYSSRSAEAMRLGTLLFKPMRAQQIETELRQLLAF